MSTASTLPTTIGSTATGSTATGSTATGSTATGSTAPAGEAGPGRPSRAGPRRRGRAFLPEVQALRALAVGLVVVYHVRPDVLPGGFVGVDVFFVVSGYLITGHLLREVRASGRISLARFWAARARRILPASLAVLAFVALTCTWVLPASEWAQTQRQLLSSVLYVENWALAADSVDYLAAENAPTAVQHFWSLGVEEQFYLLWPLAVLAAVVLARRHRLVRRGVLLLVFGGLVVASFAWNLVAVGGGDPAAYFATTARLWELGLGGVLALLVRDTARGPLLRSAAALAGVGLIVGGALLLDGAVPYPGTAALVPVVGTALVIAAGRTRGPGSLTPLVDARPVQWVGDVSYSVYLWHFPLVAYAAAWTGRDPTALEAAGLVALTLGAAALSHRYVERPFRRFRGGPRPTLLVAVVAMALVAGLTAVVPLRAAAEEARWERASASIVVGEGSGFGAEAARDGDLPAFVDHPGIFVPAPARIGDDAVSAFDEEACSARSDGPVEPRTCTVGDPHGKVTVALVGDSHARMLGSPVAELGERRGWRVVTFLRDSCPFSAEMRDRRSGPVCLAANEATLARLLELAPDAVVTASYGESRFRDPGTGERPGVRGFAEAWGTLEDAGIDVYAVKDTPLPDPEVVRCVTSSPADAGGCAVPRDEATAERDVVDDAAALVPGVRVVDLTDRFCGPDSCPAVIGNVAVYRDNNHITDTYARSLEPALGEALDAVGAAPGDGG